MARNLTSDGTTSYSYDALNRLTGTTATGQSRAYVYNGDGVLVSATANGTTTSYAQDLAVGFTGQLQDYRLGSMRRREGTACIGCMFRLSSGGHCWC